MLATDNDSEYSGAAASQRRWVARSDWVSPDPGLTLRAAYSDTVGTWHELPRQGVDEDHCTMAPLSDHAAMLVYAGQSGLAWSMVEGEQWTRSGVLDPRPWAPLHPRFRFRPSGGLWLLWTESRWVHVSSYRDGQWQRGDSLQCVHPQGTFVAGWCDASRDTAERPVLAWGDLGYGYTYRDVTCISVPTDSGWAPGEEVPGSDGGFDPTVTRDRNGDVWVAWWLLREGGVYFAHTYVSATASDPQLSGEGPSLTVMWTLSEPAPGSEWVVLRSPGDGDFQAVARLRAGASREVSWTDTTAPAATLLRYRIRRESVDARYQWESGEAEWWPRSAVMSLRLLGANPAGEQTMLELSGAEAGPLDVRLYDVQGRLALRRRPAASGLGRDTLTLDFGPGAAAVASGVYFVRVSDHGGRVSETVRIVALK